jgi:esterase/lipase superfamily enzyme
MPRQFRAPSLWALICFGVAAFHGHSTLRGQPPRTVPDAAARMPRGTTVGGFNTRPRIATELSSDRRVVVDEENNFYELKGYEDPTSLPITIVNLPNQPVTHLLAAPGRVQMVAVLKSGALGTISTTDGFQFEPLFDPGLGAVVAAFPGNDDRVAVVSAVGKGAVISVDQKKELRKFDLPGLNGPVALTPDLDFAVYSQGESVVVADLVEPHELLKVSTANAKQVAISRLYHVVAVGTEYGQIELWDIVRKSKLRQELFRDPLEVRHLQFNNYGDRLVVSRSDGTAYEFSASTWELDRRSDVAPANSSHLLQCSGGVYLSVLPNGDVFASARPVDHFNAPESLGSYQVKVHYATNRVRGETEFADRYLSFVLLPEMLVVFGAIALFAVVAVVWRLVRRILAWTAIVVLVLALTFGAGHSAWVDDPKERSLLNEVAPMLTWGDYVVSVPDSRDPGSIEVAPTLFGVKLFEDPHEHFLVLSNADRSLDEITAEVKAAKNGSDPAEFLIFVHGYNVPADAAALRTAQLKLDLEIDGPAFFFSWPSLGQTAFYTADSDNAALSTPALLEMLKSTMEKFPTSKIHVIGHSMGTRIVAEALRRSHAEPAAALPRKLTTLVLAAPDIDRRRFVIDYASVVKDVAIPVTLYASSRDVALAASSAVNNNARLGDTRPEPVVADGMETIDASLIDTDFLGHGYFAATVPLLKDLSQLIKQQRLASRRLGLRMVGDERKRYWQITD